MAKLAVVPPAVNSASLPIQILPMVRCAHAPEPRRHPPAVQRQYPLCRCGAKGRCRMIVFPMSRTAREVIEVLAVELARTEAALKLHYRSIKRPGHLEQLERNQKAIERARQLLA